MNSPSSDASTAHISIVIVNWNGEKFLPRCLEAIKTQTYRNFELIVVDNGSEDHSVALIHRICPDARLIRLEKNYGFAAANNIGAQQATGEWLLLLNNDTYIPPDTLKALVAAVQRHSQYAVFGMRLVKAENPALLDGAGDACHVSGVAWRRLHNHPVEADVTTPIEIFSPCAAAALYRREQFLRVGGFSEDYFAYHEDVDLGFRLRLIGVRCLYLPEISVAHVGSATTGVKSEFAIYHGHRNLVWSYFQNMPGTLFWKYLPAHLLMNAFFLVFYSFKGRTKAIWRAKWDALRGLPRAIRKRRKIQATRTVALAEIDRVLEHGWFEPYLLGLRARKGT